MERLLRRRKYLKAIFSGYTLSKNGQHLSQGPFRETNNNISIFKLYSIYSKINSQALCKAKTKTSGKRHYKAC